MTWRASSNRPSCLAGLEVLEGSDGGAAGSLLHALDRCASGPGRRLLRQWWGQDYYVSRAMHHIRNRCSLCHLPHFFFFRAGHTIHHIVSVPVLTTTPTTQRTNAYHNTHH